ncbi:MAG: DUF4271 domain-containing protein [Prolixibacteraceae bacterium]|nr:DUF4271 domain-containing protein [Prolixibacteraceae bacterium]
MSFVLSNQNTHLFDFYRHDPFIANWIVVLIIAVLIIIAVLRTMGDRYLGSLFHSVFNNQTALRLHREQISSNSLVVLLLELLYYTIVSAYLYHVFLLFDSEIETTGLIIYLFILLLIITFVNAKRLLFNITGIIFQSQNETGEYLFYKHSANHVIGLLLFFPAFSMFFSSGLLLNICLFLGAVIIVILSVISSVRGFFIILKKGFSVFYLILYLCTLEILPLLIVWKILW